jgi:DNA repair ATPase RecN
VPTVSIDLADKQLNEVNALMDSCRDMTAKHTEALDFVTEENARGQEPSLGEREQQKLKSVIIFAQQALTSLLETSDSLKNALLHVDDLQIKMKDTVKKLKHACRSQFSVPAELVYVSARN